MNKINDDARGESTAASAAAVVIQHAAARCVTVNGKARAKAKAKARTTQASQQARVVRALTALLMLTSLGCAAPCWAQGDAGEASAPPSEVDHATNAWLALQRSNTAAAPAQPMLGAEAGLAYQRYLTSFTSKIPESYGSMMGQGGSGGSPSGGLPQN